MNNESHKRKILRMNKSQINCVRRGSDEGQWANPGGRVSVANKTKQTVNYVEAHTHSCNDEICFVRNLLGNDSPSHGQSVLNPSRHPRTSVIIKTLAICGEMCHPLKFCSNLISGVGVIKHEGQK